MEVKVAFNLPTLLKRSGVLVPWSRMNQPIARFRPICPDLSWPDSTVLIRQETELGRLAHKYPVAAIESP